MINETLNEADQKMDKAVGVAREEFAAIRAGRATPSMFAKLTAEYYGTPTPIQQLASFTAPEARIILVAPFDVTAMPAIEKAIRESDLGVNPSNDGKTIRCVFPELTEERRKEYIKVADATAFALCMENDLPMVVFGMEPEGNILKVVQGEKIGTLVSTGHKENQ